MSGLKISRCEVCGTELDRDNAYSHLICTRCHEIEEKIKDEYERKSKSIFRIGRF